MSKHGRASKNRSGRIADNQHVRQSVPGAVVVWTVLRERSALTGTESIIGYELDHAENVTDADALAEWLDAHGHDRGHAYHPEGR